MYILLLVLSLSIVGLLIYWFAIYQKPIVAPEGQLAPKVVFTRLENIPVLGFYYRLKGIINTPVELMGKLHRQFGNFFTQRIPFYKLQITFITSHEAYRKIMKLSPETGRMGPVMKRVPTVGYWFPRAKQDETSLQELLLAGKKFMATELTSPQKVKTYHSIIQRETLDLSKAWEKQTIDMATELPDLVQKIAGRCIAGADFWKDYGETIRPLLKTIGEGIDIVRVSLSVTPLHYFMPEYQATKKLYTILKKAIAVNERTGKYELITKIRAMKVDGKAIHEKDIPWMLMYFLWNSLTYPGSYIFWMVMDIISNPKVLQAAQKTDNHKKHHNLLKDCFIETIRLNPVASLVRHVTDDLTIEADGNKYFVPKGGYLAVFIEQLAKDPAYHKAENEYNPFRYQTGEKVPALFGMGAFGCIAKQFSIALAVNITSVLLQKFDFKLIGEMPERRSRVHLTYANTTVPVEVKTSSRSMKIAEMQEIHSHPPMHHSGDISKCPFHALFGKKRA